MSDNIINNEINEDDLNKTLEKLNELEENNDDIDNIIDNPDAINENEQENQNIKFDSRLLVNALASFSKIASRKFKIPEIELTDEDKEDLKNALSPFEDRIGEWIKYLPYLPLAIFVIGYSLRVYTAYKEKKDKEKQIKKELKEENKENKKEENKENNNKNEGDNNNSNTTTA